VTELEPLPADHPLRSAPNLLLTPHVAWFSVEARRELQTKAAEEVARALRGSRSGTPPDPSRHLAPLDRDLDPGEHRPGPSGRASGFDAGEVGCGYEACLQR